MYTLKLLPTVQNVAANSKAVLACPVGLTYRRIIVKIGGTLTLANIQNIRLLINGVVQQEYATAAVVKALNSFYNRAGATAEADSDHFTLWFSRPELANGSMRELLALGTADVSSMSIEMDIATATSPTLTAYAEFAAPRKMGAIAKVRNFPKTLAVGANEFDTIPRTGGRILAMHLSGTKADLGAIDVQADSAIVWESRVNTAGGVSDVYVADGCVGMRRVVQANFVHIDFCADGDLEQALVTQGMQDLRLRPTVTANGGLYTAIVEYADGFGRS